jgi:Arc/MetJ-type ribon-helix-helix transcriptional regulator
MGVKKKPNPYSERMTVNLTPDQMRRLEELRNVRSRVGNFVSKNDLLRDAVNYYLAAQEDLPGSRRAIAKGIESKVEALDGKVEALTTMLSGFIERVTRRREG